jgi:outer membrane protein TolC
VRSADAQKKLLDDTRVAPKADVAEAETQLNTTRVQASDIMVQRAQYEHALAILIGKPPAEFSLPVAPQPAVSKASSSSRRRPSELLERRPDVATAERRMAAANEQIGIAKAAYYPSLSIAAVGGLEGNSFSNWFTYEASSPQASTDSSPANVPFFSSGISKVSRLKKLRELLIFQCQRSRHVCAVRGCAFAICWTIIFGVQTA